MQGGHSGSHAYSVGCYHYICIYGFPTTFKLRRGIAVPRFLFLKNQTLTVALVLGRQPKLIATMKKLFLIVAAMFAVVSFSACSDDDDNKDASIVGTWQRTHSEGWVTYSDGTRDEISEDYPAIDDAYYWTLNFQENGTMIRTSYSDNGAGHSSNYTYTIAGKTLTTAGSEGSIKYEIQSLSTKNLTLFEKGEKEDGEKFEYTYTYKKI